MKDISPNTMRRIADLDCWQGDIAVEQLTGGLSNESYVVTDSERRLVVRFGEDFWFHHVSRAHESMVARAAHAADVAPEVIHSGPGVMVCAFIDGHTYGAEEVRANIPRIVDVVRRFHNELPLHVAGPGVMFWAFHVIRDYGRMLVEAESRMADSVPRYLEMARAFESVQVPLPIVYGHHDLLPANFIDDGRRLWLIDFEYAGYGTAMFDLAGIASNAEFDPDQSDLLLAEYFKAEPGDDLRRSLAAMQCASLLREAMWSMVSELYLDAPGADYAAYTEENLERLARATQSYQAHWGRL